MQLAPVVLFAYNRPQHVKKTLDSLTNNELARESDLFIYADGPKAEATSEQIKKIKEVRKVLREKNWCKTVTIIESQINQGLAKSIIKGVTEVVNKYGKVIVIEDDVIFSPFFLKFMNEGLETYKDDQKVLSIGSWSYFCTPEKIEGETYFFRFPDCKGWATFDRAWKLFETDAAQAYKKLKDGKLFKYFNANLPVPHFQNMLQQQIDGKVNSWAIRWTATSVLNEKLNLFPSRTLARDIGFDEEATHNKGAKDYNAHLEISTVPVKVISQKAEESAIAVEAWRQFYINNIIPVVPFWRKTLRRILPQKLITVYRLVRYSRA